MILQETPPPRRSSVATPPSRHQLASPIQEPRPRSRSPSLLLRFLSSFLLRFFSFSLNCVFSNLCTLSHTRASSFVLLTIKLSLLRHNHQPLTSVSLYFPDLANPVSSYSTYNITSHDLNPPRTAGSQRGRRWVGEEERRGRGRRRKPGETTSTSLSLKISTLETTSTSLDSWDNIYLSGIRSPKFGVRILETKSPFLRE